MRVRVEIPQPPTRSRFRNVSRVMRAALTLRASAVLVANRVSSGTGAVAPRQEVGEITTHGLALSRLKHGFESRREGPKEVRSSLRRQSFSSDSKREVIAPALGRTRRGFAPATRQLREAESRMRGAGEGEGIAHRLVKDRRPFFR